MGRFLLLRLVALFFMLLAVVVLCLSVYIYLVIDMNAEQLIRVLGIDPSWRNVSTLFAGREMVMGIILSICLFGLGLFLLLMISIEGNTHQTALLLERLVNQSSGRQHNSDLAPVAPNWSKLPEPTPLAEIAKQAEKRRRRGTLSDGI